MRTQCAGRCGLEVQLCEDLILCWKALNMCAPAASGSCRLQHLSVEGTQNVAAQAHEPTEKIFRQNTPLGSEGICFFLQTPVVDEYCLLLK